MWLWGDILKKLLSVALVILMIFSAGCKENVSDQTEQDKTGNLQQENIEIGEVQFHGNAFGAEGEQGFYEIYMHRDMTGNLMYTDYATKTRAVLCNRPACTHDSNKCTAWFGEIYNMPRPIVSEGKLYLMYFGNPHFYEFGQEKALPRIDQLNLDGTYAKTIATFNADEQLNYASATDEANFYIISISIKRDGDSSSSNWNLLQVSKDTGAITQLRAFGNESDGQVLMMGAANGKLVFKRIAADKALFAKMQDGTLDNFQDLYESQVHSYFLYPQQNAADTLVSWQQDKAKEGAFGDYLYLFSDSGVLKKINITTKQQTVLTSELNGYTPRELMFYSAFSNYIVVDATKFGDAPGLAVTTRFIIDTQTGEATKNNLYTNYNGVKEPIKIIDATKNMLYVVSALNAAPAVITEADSFKIYNRLLQSYALISQEDFLAGNAEFEKINP